MTYEQFKIKLMSALKKHPQSYAIEIFNEYVDETYIDILYEFFKKELDIEMDKAIKEHCIKKYKKY